MPMPILGHGLGSSGRCEWRTAAAFVAWGLLGACEERTDTAPAVAEEKRVERAVPDNAPTRSLPPEPAPPGAAKAGDVPELREKLAAIPAWSAITSGNTEYRADLELVLATESHVLSTGGLAGPVLSAMNEREDLKSIVGLLGAIEWRTGTYPTEFVETADAYFESVASEPNLGLWTASPSAGPYPIDLTALAVRLHRDSPSYVRERIASLRASGPVEWLNDKHPPSRAYLVSERDALEWLALLTSLTEAESRRLTELRSTASNDARNSLDTASVVAQRYEVDVGVVHDKVAKAAELCLGGMEVVLAQPAEAVALRDASVRFVEQSSRDAKAREALPPLTRLS